ncbi:MAG: BrnT family toxin [Novosphingobium sp.]
MRFEWDEAKNRANQHKHGISFELALRVFADPFHVLVPDRIVGGEVRWQAFGVIPFGLLMVVHTSRDEDEIEVIRIISARPATKHERRRYEDENI